MRQYQIPTAGKIENLKLVDVPEPKPAHGQVLVRLRAASLNYRDLMIIENRYGAEMKPNLVPLSDGAGEVTAVGDGVTRVKVGDRVAGIFHQKYLGGRMTDAFAGSALGGDLPGVLSEMRVFEQDGLVHVPEPLSFDEAATLPCASVTAWDALFNGQHPLQPGDSVLTLGTGGVSVFAIQFAAAAGARVISTSSSDDKLAKSKSLGAGETINYRSTPDWDKVVKEMTGGAGVDHVVEVGGPGTLPKSLKSVRRGGEVSVIGLLTGPGGEINPLVLIPRAASMRGIYVGSRETFEAMNRAIVAKGIKPVIDRTFAFEDAPAAYQHLKSGSHFGKIVIRF